MNVFTAVITRRYLFPFWIHRAGQGRSSRKQIRNSFLYALEACLVNLDLSYQLCICPEELKTFLVASKVLSGFFVSSKIVSNSDGYGCWDSLMEKPGSKYLHFPKLVLPGSYINGN